MKSCSDRTSIKPATFVRGTDLWMALGFNNARAFQRAYRTGRIGLRLYPIPGQSRGVFARADELATFLAKSGSKAMDPPAAKGAASGDDATRVYEEREASTR